MKKLLLPLMTLTLLALAAPTFAAQSSDLVLTGSVDQDMSIEFSPSALASALDLKSDAAQGVGELHYRSNSNSGYEIQFSDTNSGRMRRGASEDKISFSLSGSHDQEILAAGNAARKIEVSAGIPVDITQTLNFVSANVMDAQGSEQIPEQLVAGSYSDTVTAAISAK